MRFRHAYKYINTTGLYLVAHACVRRPDHKMFRQWVMFSRHATVIERKADLWCIIEYRSRLRHLCLEFTTGISLISLDYCLYIFFYRKQRYTFAHTQSVKISNLRNKKVLSALVCSILCRKIKEYCNFRCFGLSTLRSVYRLVCRRYSLSTV